MGWMILLMLRIMMMIIILAMNQNCDHNLYDDAGEMIVVSSE